MGFFRDAKTLYRAYIKKDGDAHLELAQNPIITTTPEEMLQSMVSAAQCDSGAGFRGVAGYHLDPDMFPETGVGAVNFYIALLCYNRATVLGDTLSDNAFDELLEYTEEFLKDAGFTRRVSNAIEEDVLGWWEEVFGKPSTQEKLFIMYLTDVSNGDVEVETPKTL